MAILLCSLPVFAKAQNAKTGESLHIGDPAPEIIERDQSGKEQRLSDYRGRTVVLMFYPKSFTSGCRGEVRSVRDEVIPTKNKDVVVFGVSPDTVATQKSFVQTEKLNFALLADAQQTVANAYHVATPDGHTRRVTYIVGPDGNIRAIDDTVDTQFTGTAPDGALISRHGERLRLLLSDWKAVPGSIVPVFFLPNYDGKTVTNLRSGDRASVLVFVGANCPASQVALYKMKRLTVSSVYHNVTFLAIEGNANVTGESVATLANHVGAIFPIARDLFNEVTDRFGAKRSPTFYVLDSTGKVVYSGAFDGEAEQRPDRCYVREALDAVLMRRPIAVPEIPVTEGTPITPWRG